ncbi:MAG: hypothetical protein FJX64_08695 [Alphaproteobacteria bacterium]|nr:hypothetical protein [Alphaproteobacteria bacterium]
MGDAPKDPATDLIPLTDAELLQTLTFAARQNRELFSERRKIPWWDDRRPELLAQDQVKRMRLAGIQAFRRQPIEPHGRGFGIAPPEEPK